MFIRSVTQKGIFPNHYCIDGPTGKRITNYGKLSNGYNIKIDNFVMNGKTLRKDYCIWNDKVIHSVYKVWDKITGKFKRTTSRYSELDL